MEIDLDNKVKEALVKRGFTKETLLNNRGLIGATVDEVKNLILFGVSRSKRVNLVIDSTNGDYILTDKELKEYEDNELFMDGDKVYKAELVKEY